MPSSAVSRRCIVGCRYRYVSQSAEDGACGILRGCCDPTVRSKDFLGPGPPLPYGKAKLQWEARHATRTSHLLSSPLTLARSSLGKLRATAPLAGAHGDGAGARDPVGEVRRRHRRQVPLCQPVMAVWIVVRRVRSTLAPVTHRN